MFDDVDWKDLGEFLLVLAIGLLIGVVAAKLYDGQREAEIKARWPDNATVYYVVSEDDAPVTRLPTGFKVIEPKAAVNSTAYFYQPPPVPGCSIDPRDKCKPADMKGGNRL